jgi:hypothetical protein
MKKVLLTTTALTLAAGVASAEITFSGKGEAGFYRTAPTAAVTAVNGRDVTITGVDAASTAATTATDVVTNFAATDKVATATTAADNEDIIEYVDGVLTVTASSGDNSGIAAAPTAAELAAFASQVIAAEAAVAAAATVDAKALAQAQLAIATKALEVLTGTAAAGKGATPNLAAYSGYDFNVAVSGASDNGMTFAMGFDMGEGMIADQDDDRAMDAQGAAIATSAMTIGYAGYTIEIGDDKIDDVYDDSQNGDVSIAGALGDLTFKIVHDMDDDVQAVAASQVYDTTTAGAHSFTDTAAVAAVYNTTSYSLGYTMGDVAFAMASTDHDDRGNAASSFSLTYTMSDALSATYSVDNVGTYKDIAKLAATAKISDMLSITASVKDDKDHALNTNTGGKQSQDVSISYAAGSLGATIATDESSNWWVNAQYDLGGGAQAFTTFDHSEFLVAGVNFAF